MTSFSSFTNMDITNNSVIVAHFIFQFNWQQIDSCHTNMQSSYSSIWGSKDFT